MDQTIEMMFDDAEHIVSSMAALGLRRFPGAVTTYIGTTYGDNGERIATIARKSGEFSFTFHERTH